MEDRELGGIALVEDGLFRVVATDEVTIGYITQVDGKWWWAQTVSEHLISYEVLGDVYRKLAELSAPEEE